MKAATHRSRIAVTIEINAMHDDRRSTPDRICEELRMQFIAALGAAEAPLAGVDARKVTARVVLTERFKL